VNEARASDLATRGLLLWATTSGLIASVTPLDPPGGAEVDGSGQPRPRATRL
jgi:hypothetical protein